nr:flagellin [uncultured bacterium]
MSELASQSSSGIVTDAERAHLQSEFADLIAQVDRLANGAGYNGISVLNAASTLDIQVGLDGTAASRISVATVDVTSATLLGATPPAIGHAGRRPGGDRAAHDGNPDRRQPARRLRVG